MKSKKKKSRRKKSKRNKNKKVVVVRQPEEPYIYCGNNALHPDVVSGRAVIGTLNRCLRKGFGSGYHQPVNNEFLNPYEAIDERKVYCGNKEELPAGYSMRGRNSWCFQKGFAVGSRKKALE